MTQRAHSYVTMHNSLEDDHIFACKIIVCEVIFVWKCRSENQQSNQQVQTQNWGVEIWKWSQRNWNWCSQGRYILTRAPWERRILNFLREMMRISYMSCRNHNASILWDSFGVINSFCKISNVPLHSTKYVDAMKLSFLNPSFIKIKEASVSLMSSSCDMQG